MLLKYHPDYTTLLTDNVFLVADIKQNESTGILWSDGYKDRR